MQIFLKIGQKICILISCIILILAFESDLTDTYNSRWAEYPLHIENFDVRKDSYTNLTVSRGLLPEYFIDNIYRQTDISALVEEMTFDDFNRRLQCSPSQSELEGNRGSISLMKLVPTTKEIVELMCTWAETDCSTWSECQTSRLQFKEPNGYPSSWGMYMRNDFQKFHLRRIMNRKIYLDWPWGRERINEFRDSGASPLEPMPYDRDVEYLFRHVLQSITDIGDSVFFMGEECAFFPPFFPFPAFSMAPRMDKGDMPWPWAEEFTHAVVYYFRALNTKNFTDAFHESGPEMWGHVPWEARIPKLAFFSSYKQLRHVACDQAVMRPDLIDAVCSGTIPKTLFAWNPLSDEPSGWASKEDLQSYINTIKADPAPTADAKPGTLKHLFKLPLTGTYKHGEYKYILVIGYQESSTGRLADLIAHSGAVVLLAESAFSYHFSSRLQPWVHYVPVTYSGSDIIEKVEWLRAHDDLALRIANNAKNFGKSYLRLEDFYCYAATALKTIGDLQKGSSATDPF